MPLESAHPEARNCSDQKACLKKDMLFLKICQINFRRCDMYILQIAFKALEVVADVAVLVLAVKMIRERR